MQTSNIKENLRQTVFQKIRNNIKDYVNSLKADKNNEVYKNNELLILSCFAKSQEIVEKIESKFNGEFIEKPNKSEISIIENALQAYWYDAKTKLDINGEIIYHGSTKSNMRSLGTIERKQLEERVKLITPLLEKYRNL